MNIEEYYNEIWENQKAIKEGKLLAIPFPYKKVTAALPGIMRGKMYVITAETKVGKTQFMSYSFLYQMIEYAYEHRELNIRIIYAALEESETVIIDRYVTYIVFKHFGVRLNGQKIRGYNKSGLLKEEEIQAINNGRIKDKVRFFLEHIDFITDRSREKIIDKCKGLLMTNGTIETKYERIKDEYTGQWETSVIFDKYKPNDPDQWNFIIIDHIGCIEAKNDLKGEIDKLGQELIRIRNVYNMTSIIIQQQTSIGTMEIKRGEDARRNLASKDRLADSRYTGQNADYVIGVSSPYKLMKHLPLELQIWDKKYNVGRLKNCLTVIELLLSRHGPCFTPMPLFFDGATCSFHELPIFNGINDSKKEDELEEEIRYAEKLNNTFQE